MTTKVCACPMHVEVAMSYTSVQARMLVSIADLKLNLAGVQKSREVLLLPMRACPVVSKPQIMFFANS